MTDETGEIALDVLARHHRRRGMGRTEFACLVLASGIGGTGPDACAAWDRAPAFSGSEGQETQ